MNPNIREMYSKVGFSWIALVPPMRARKHFSLEALKAYEQSIAEFVDAAALDPSDRTIRLACDVMSQVADLDTEASFFQDEAVKVTLEAAATRMRTLLYKVVPTPEPYQEP
jgi:hypothetical protein